MEFGDKDHIAFLKKYSQREDTEMSKDSGPEKPREPSPVKNFTVEFGAGDRIEIHCIDELRPRISEFSKYGRLECNPSSKKTFIYVHDTYDSGEVFEYVIKMFKYWEFYL